MSTINKIAIKNSLGEYDESKIGAQAEDVIISRDADGKIIETIETPGVVIGSTEGISTTIKEIDERIASTSSIGQVQIGTGLEIDNNGVLTPSFGNTTGSICEGNDPRLASIGTVANDLVLSSNGDGDAAGATFNGGAAVKISYNSIGAAPNQKATTSQWGQIKIKSNSGLGVDSTNGLSLSSHASASNTYGVGTNANYGHLKIVDATSSTSGTSYNAAAGVAASASSVADVISQISNLATYITDKVLDSDFASDIGATTNRTIVFNNLVKRPTQVAYIPEHNQWVTQAVQSITINNNSVAVTVIAYGFVSTNYARVGGRLVYR